jgi:hypothetical protein
MGLFSFFQGGAKYFDKKIDPKCDYCTFGKRTKDGNRVLCEKRGLVEQTFSCKAFIYSPLKRIPVKQLRFVGSIADDDIFIESKGDLAEKAEAENKTPNGNKKTNEKAKPAAKEDKAAKPDAPAKEAESAPAKEAPKKAEPEKKAEATPEKKDAPAKEAPKQAAQNAQPAKQEAPKK